MADDWTYPAYEDETEAETVSRDIGDIPVVSTIVNDIGGLAEGAADEEARRNRAMALMDLARGNVRTETWQTAGPAQGAQVYADPASQAYQQRALQALTMAGRGAYGAVDAAAAHQGESAAAAELAALNSQVAGAMGGRGLGRSGAALSAGARGAGGAGRNAAGRAVGAESDAQRRALASLSGAAGLATARRGHSGEEQGRRAGAFNQRATDDWRRRAGVGQRNADRRNSNVRDRAAVYQGRADQAASDAAAAKEDQDNLITGIIGALS